MDKLKENLFGIGVGVLAVVLLALVYLLVISPLQSLGAKQERIAKLTRKFESDARKKKIAIPEYLEFLEEQKAANEAVFDEGVAFYDEQARKFHSYFNDAPDPGTVASFAAKYKSSIEKLVSDYRGRFGIQETQEVGRGEEVPPAVDQMQVDLPEQMPRAMKEFWMVQEFFKACDKLQIGGLKKISFAGRMAAEKKAQPFHRYVEGTFTLEVEFSKLENLLTELYASPRVPFVLKQLSFQKTPELLGKYLDLKVSINESTATAGKAYGSLVPEPPVVVTLVLLGLDWKGVPAPAPGDDPASR